MIQTNELRIGNWVLLNNTFKRVLWFKYNKVCVMNEYPSAIVDIDRLNSILLTEDVLLKCGFVILKNGNSYIETETLGKLFIYKDGSVKWNDRYIDAKVESLHQLQNLYFALVGKELKIEL